MLMTLLLVIPVMQGPASTQPGVGTVTVPPQWESPLPLAWEDKKPIEIDPAGNYVAWREAYEKTSPVIICRNRADTMEPSTFLEDHQQCVFKPDRKRERWTVLPERSQLNQEDLRQVFSFTTAIDY